MRRGGACPSGADANSYKEGNIEENRKGPKEKKKKNKASEVG